MAAKKKAPKRKRGNRSAISKLTAGKPQGKRVNARTSAPNAVSVKKPGGRRGSRLAIGSRKGGARKLTGGGAVTRGMFVNRTAKRASGKRMGSG